MASPAADGCRPPPHLLVFPFPAQGHLIPLLDLCTHLAARFALSITVVVTPKNLHLLSSYISSTTQIHSLVLSLPPSSSLPSGVEHVRDLPNASYTISLISALASLRPSIFLWAESQSHPPTALLSDFFLGWCADLAADLHIPHLAFFSSGALLAALLHPLFVSLPSPPSSSSLISVSPSLPSFPFHHLPTIYRRYVSGNPDWELTRCSILANSRSSAAIFNTFEFLESPYLTHLRSAAYASGRILAVGPIPTGVRTSAGDLIPWLDSCSAHSVVYLCFGSQFTLEPAAAAVLASALEMTAARFVWVLGKETAELPKGFEEITKGRGLVVRGWAEQRAALGHVAVAAFVTHCGWNSVLEGMTAGVLLLLWPMEADQFVNARLLEEAGVAVRMCAGGPSTLPNATAAGRLMTEAVTEGTWPELRKRASEMQRRIRESVGEGGSSFLDMEELGKLLTYDR